ncbi:hypothetical protein RhiirA1_475622 [Rhizophagus irregularis]|uniref:Uncharacterized protein n=2 Tax=Rhizophagus irregularis TaxID=588596 RepID=A0A2I1FF50_9GLOM|nr:hypothetical protein RhiirA1_475622 [Rhizophagus irregularis]PKY32994.1 hypothetical protein RhiirB3_451581 [Rhizophagus irregularis]CAB4487061.1 unnamed protein product [Rhizophagus irregularis]
MKKRFWFWTSFGQVLDKCPKRLIVQLPNTAPRLWQAILVIVADLHIFNQLRVLETFTSDIKQCSQKKVKYAYGFGKMKKTLNLALDMGCKNEIIDMINGFIDQKKAIIKDTNITNDEANFQILDPVVQKRYGYPPNKQIKLASESNSRHVNTKNSAINPIDSNLCIREVQQQS